MTIKLKFPIIANRHNILINTESKIQFWCTTQILDELPDFIHFTHITAYKKGSCIGIPMPFSHVIDISSKYGLISVWEYFMKRYLKITKDD